MINLMVEPGIILLSSLISLVLIYYQVSPTTLQQILLGLVIILLVLNRLSRFFSWPLLAKLFRFLLLFLIAWAVQLLVLLSGGFFSPFLVLYHLFIIGSSFLLSFGVAAGFLFFSLVTLMGQVWWDSNLSVLVGNDPWSAVLYSLSFMIITPLSYLVATKYHLKDRLSVLLSQQIRLTKLREKSLLSGLFEMVLITDTKWRILSFNEAAEKGLRFSPSELFNRSLFEVLFLKDTNGRLMNEELLSLDRVMEDKAARIISNLLLYVKNTLLPQKVSLLIKPTVNLEGKIDQLVFVLSQAQSSRLGERVHYHLDEALLRHDACVEELKKQLSSRGLTGLRAKVELLGKAERDLLSAMEIEDHGIRSVAELVDIGQLLSRIVEREQDLATGLNTTLSLLLDTKYLKEAQKLIPEESKVLSAQLTSPYFTAPVDKKWFDVLVSKLLEVAILLSSSKNNSQVKVSLTYDRQTVNLTVMTDFKPQSDKDYRLVFTEYYGNLGLRTNLHLGSGLEGVMAKSVATLLGIPLEAGLDGDSLGLFFHLKLSKRPS